MSIRRIAALYGGLLLAGSLGIALLAGSPASAATPAASGGAVTEAGRGGQLFLMSCANCHGAQGQGTASGPDIRNAGAALTDFMLRTGRMPMGDTGQPAHRATPAFSVADQQALVAFVTSLGQGSPNQGPAIPNVVTSGADVSAGRNLYVANCAACHGPAGGGGAVGGGFVAPNLMQADATTVGEAILSGPGPMPRFSFAPDQLGQIAAYVQYLQNAPHPGGATSPEVGPVTEGFIAALTLLGLLVVARWVAVRGGQGKAPIPLAGHTGDEGDDDAGDADGEAPAPERAR